MSGPVFGMARKDSPDGREVRLALSGEFDLVVHEQLQKAVMEAVNPPAETVVIDLDEVSFIDSGVVGILLQGWHAARGNGCGYRIVNARGLVHQILKITGVYEVLTRGDELDLPPDPRQFR